MAVKTADSPPRVPPQSKMTFEEFLDWCDEDTWAEWVDGDVQMVTPANFQYQNLVVFLTSLLLFYAQGKKLGLVLNAPFLMRLPSISRGREPDILFVRQEHNERFHNTYLDGAADLVVEIISPESIVRDRGDKFVEYEQAGVSEYWMIDPSRHRAEFFVLDSTNVYQNINPDPSGIYRSHVVDGFWLRVDWLWQEPLPMAEDVLREIREG
ncbi:MAG: Uma2 family endonuclease [Chloroflexi bacterium]|nr:Uma2 family endonuclease [Chloroflexota bacterium]